MKIRRFEAPDTRSALALVKAEMGDDAVILTKKTISSGQRQGDLTRRCYVEVVAARDYDVEALAASAPALDKLVMSSPEPDKGPQPSGRQELTNAAKAVGKVSLTSGPVKATSQTTFRIAETDIDARDAANSGSAVKNFQQQFNKLVRHNSTSLNIKEVEADRKKAIPSGELAAKARKPKAEDVAKWRDQLISRITYKSLAADANQGKPLVLAMVGPTGVGKTTNAAKIAAWFYMRHGSKVTLVSMDCYRIGATDQLRTYARIMQMPCEIVLKKRDLTRALERHGDKDLIIIDTAGKNPYDEHHVTELQDWFHDEQGIEPYLNLSATTKKEDLAYIVQAYNPLMVSGLMLTKLDETRTYASLCQQVVAASLPVAGISTGQRVPEDFMMASQPFVDKLFKGGWPAVADEVGMDVCCARDSGPKTHAEFGRAAGRIAN